MTGNTKNNWIVKSSMFKQKINVNGDGEENDHNWSIVITPDTDLCLHVMSRIPKIIGLTRREVKMVYARVWISTDLRLSTELALTDFWTYWFFPVDFIIDRTFSWCVSLDTYVSIGFGITVCYLTTKSSFAMPSIL